MKTDPAQTELLFYCLCLEKDVSIIQNSPFPDRLAIVKISTMLLKRVTSRSCSFTVNLSTCNVLAASIDRVCFSFHKKQ